jgi:DNA-binding HxlR family transcriptional regulator
MDYFDHVPPCGADGHRLRFSAMMGSIDGITQRMLTLTLRNLERDGLLTRHYYPEVPPRVEYELTAMGASMLPGAGGIHLMDQGALAND